VACPPTASSRNPKEPKLQIAPATSLDVDSTAKCFSSAFSTDPLISYFFADHPAGRDAAAEQFFLLLMRARIALGMPALVARDGDRLLGGAMGYTTAQIDWPAEIKTEWDALEHGSPVIAERFDLYGRISDAVMPPEPHYYLGVIGVAPEAKGTGAGGALLQAFCRLSADDPRSSGVYLETANPDNVPFYIHHGFDVRGSGALGAGTLWCLFHRHSR
jgi:GNAT superfamily N-acetyltransferase